MGIASWSTGDGQPPGQTVRAPGVGALDDRGIGVSETTQEVRFAVAMSGGVSLAVWMGGVAREINLLQQASNVRLHEAAAGPGGPVPGPGAPGAAPGAPGRTDWDVQSRDLYLRLLRCLDVSVTVDVLAGTSAGGVNAALLGLSSAAGADLAMLRDLWLTAGSMDLLLRDPGEKNPPSLMQGDKVLFTQLTRGIEGLYRDRPRDLRLAPVASPSQPVDTTVFITTTMMAGEAGQFTDDYGTVVPDVDHHGLFTFGQEDLTPGRGAHDLPGRPGPGRPVQRLVPGGVRAVLCPDRHRGPPAPRDPAPAGHAPLRQHDPQPLGRRRRAAGQPAARAAAVHRPGPPRQPGGPAGAGVRRARRRRGGGRGARGPLGDTTDHGQRAQDGPGRAAEPVDRWRAAAHPRSQRPAQLHE